MIGIIMLFSWLQGSTYIYVYSYIILYYCLLLLACCLRYVWCSSTMFTYCIVQYVQSVFSKCCEYCTICSTYCVHMTNKNKMIPGSIHILWCKGLLETTLNVKFWQNLTSLKNDSLKPKG